MTAGLSMLVRKIRPRFRLPVKLGAAEVLRDLERRLDDPACPCAGSVAERHRVVELRVRGPERHFWSPSLSVTVADGEDDRGCVVHGVVGPNPDVWTMFALTYIGLLTTLSFALMLGLVQWWLGQTAWGLWISVALLAGAVAMYALSQLGQRLAAPQTAMLRHFLEEALGAPPAERAVTERDPYHREPARPSEPPV